MCCTSVEQGALSKERILLICSITLVTMVLTGQRNDLSRAVHQSVTIVNKLMFCVARRVTQPLAAPSLGSASWSLRSHKLVRQPGNMDHQIKKNTSRKNGTDTPRCKAPPPNAPPPFVERVVALRSLPVPSVFPPQTFHLATTQQLVLVELEMWLTKANDMTCFPTRAFSSRVSIHALRSIFELQMRMLTHLPCYSSALL